MSASQKEFEIEFLDTKVTKDDFLAINNFLEKYDELPAAEKLEEKEVEYHNNIINVSYFSVIFYH